MSKRETFITIRTEGALLPPDLLQNIAFGSGIAGLSPESYHLAGERLNEAITRAWNRMLGAWANFKAAREKLAESDIGTTITRERWLLPLFQELGYGRLQTMRAYEIEGKSYNVSHIWGHTPIHLITFRAELDIRTSGMVGASRMSPHGMMQEFLNRADEHLWAFVSNGLRLRILRDNSSLTRQSYLEFDLEAMMEGEVYADFVLLWLLCHQSRVEADKTEDCWLEKWSRFAQVTGKRVLDKFRDSVEAAITTLGAGFIACPENRELREQLRSGTLNRQDYYRQVLRMVYRLIFLFVAEDREVLLLPDAPQPAQDAYTKYYSTSRLRRLAEKQRGTQHVDLMRGLWLLFDKLGNDGCPDIALPALGSFLWSQQAVAGIAGCDISNKDLLAAIRTLAFTIDNNVRRSVDFRNLGSEELGSVYESLLELHPDMNLEAGTFVLQTAGGNERKTTGSYYTPTSLIDCLLDSALNPVLDDACKKPNPIAAVLDLKIVDPACGSGHFLVRAARRVAKRLAALHTGDDEPSPAAVQHALREVIGRCIYGVDINPMSVELCKVSLWMESLEPGKPLSFLEHHIQCGNSLLGVPLPSQVEAAKAEIERKRKAAEARIEELRFPAARDRELDKERKKFSKELIGLRYTGYPESIPDEAFTPLEGDDKAICQYYRKQNQQEREQGGLFAGDLQPWEQLGDLAAAIATINGVDDGDIDGIRRKQHLYEEFRNSDRFHSGQFIADAWCAAFMWKKDNSDHYPITHQSFIRIKHNPHDVPMWMLDEIDRLTTQYQFFQWHIVFPEVFNPLAGATGGIIQWEDIHFDPSLHGFDVVLGNPPWDTLSPDAKEFFSAYNPLIRSADKDDQQAIINDLLQVTQIADSWANNNRMLYSTANYLKESGHYRLFAPGNLGKGDFNVFRMFIELAFTITREHGGFGQVVPEGLYNGANSMALRQALFDECNLLMLYGFENAGGVWFEGIHRSQKFAIYAARKGGGTLFFRTAFNIRSLAQFDTVLMGDSLSLPVSIVREFSPDALAIMEFGNQRDIVITTKMYARWPKFGEFQAGQPFRYYMREIDMGNDRELFSDDPLDIPVYEGRMVDQYDHRAKGYCTGRGRSADWVEFSFIDPQKAMQSQWFVPKSSIPAKIGDRYMNYRIGFCDIACPTNARTFVATLIPPAVLCGHKVPTITFDAEYEWYYPVWLAVANSFTMDFLTRKKVSLTMSYTVLDSLPFPRLSIDYPLFPYIMKEVLRLTCTGPEMAGYWNTMAQKGWVEPVSDNSIPPGYFSIEDRLQARAILEVIVARDLYGLTIDELAYILDTFPTVRKYEMQSYGEFRTKRLILEYYDAISSGKSYKSVIGTLAWKSTSTKVLSIPVPQDTQVFPHDGRETFVYECIPQLVALQSGRIYEYYVDAALLASHPERLRALLSDESQGRLASLQRDGLDSDALPETQRIRAYDMREDLTNAETGCLAVDPDGVTKLANPEAVTAMDNSRQQLLLLALEAAEKLHPALPDPETEQVAADISAFLERVMAADVEGVHR